MRIAGFTPSRGAPRGRLLPSSCFFTFFSSAALAAPVSRRCSDSAWHLRVDVDGPVGLPVRLDSEAQVPQPGDTKLRGSFARQGAFFHGLGPILILNSEGRTACA